jgi:hypothetical protein
METTEITLERHFFTDHPRTIARFAGMTAELFRYPSGIEAIRIANRRGHLVILPFFGQMIWDAVFDGIDLSMTDMFSQPRPAEVIVGTYGCFAYHSGLLANGCPSPQDTHPLHGEMPCAPMDGAGLAMGSDQTGPWLALTGRREYVMGFGAHYLARPSVTLRPDDALFDIAMQVDNLSGDAMDLMYMCHINFAFVEGGRIVQPAGFTPADTVVRTVIPAHVRPTEDYRMLLGQLAADPSVMATLNQPHRYNPEQVFYIRNLKADRNGDTRLLLRRPEGDAFSIAYNRDVFPHTVRWVLVNSDQKVAAFAIPSTCEPEGYLAEKAKGHVRSLAGGATARFTVRLGHLSGGEADQAERQIAGFNH